MVGLDRTEPKRILTPKFIYDPTFHSAKPGRPAPPRTNPHFRLGSGLLAQRRPVHAAHVLLHRLVDRPRLRYAPRHPLRPVRRAARCRRPGGALVYRLAADALPPRCQARLAGRG